ncbi:MAG: sterol desaturase family protein, partial [Ignavibacteria bacterium]
MNGLDQIRIWSAVAVVAGASILILLERLLPFTRQKLLRRGLGTDLALYALAQSFVMGMVISYIISLIDEHTSLSRWQDLRSQALYVQFGVVFVVHDFYIYWFHRWQHRNTVLWR